MTVKRHSRDMVRHQRERWINRTKRLCREIFSDWVPEPRGELSKFTLHRHKCDVCNPRYNRAKEKQRFLKEYN